ncbi:uncharacterized protein V3H82_010854 isoform 2-T2 [Fundulus diaphanus]
MWLQLTEKDRKDDVSGLKEEVVRLVAAGSHQSSIMTVHHALFFFFLLSLQVRNCRSAEVLRKIYGAAGEDIRAQCGLYLSGSWKIFCRENCEGGNILIRTKESKAQSGRYSTECVTGAPSGWFILYVSISGLTQSDSGRYRCGLGDSLSSASYQDFRLVLVDAVLDGNKDPHVYKEAGSSLTVACSFGSSGRTKSFSRGEPGEEEVLVKTDGVRGEGGRYSLEYDEQPSGGVLLVTITQLTQSDSGRYRCKMDRTVLPDLYRDFHVTFRAVDPSVSTPPPRTSISSSSGSYTPSVSSETTDLSVLTQWSTTTSQDAANRGSAEVLRFVALTLVIIIILLSVALLVCCRKRSEKHHTALLVQTENATESYRIKEDVREEDQQWRSADVEIYVAYRETTTTKPTEAETSQSCSSATATTSQHQAEDDWNKVIYAEVKFSNKKTASAPRSSCGTMTDVIYAEPQVAKTSHDEPLHSNAA